LSGFLKALRVRVEANEWKREVRFLDPKVVLYVALLSAIAFALVWVRERHRAHRVRHSALVDPLTRLPNRLAFYERLSDEWARARRYRRPLGLLLLDMDGLKQINDTHGHGVGDRALRAMAESISAEIRATDYAARLAGDEFVVLCPETVGSGLQLLAEALGARFDALPLGVSLGVAEYQAADLFPEDMVTRADEAMYREKRRRHGSAQAAQAATARPSLATSGSSAIRAS
jgi:diguanylate cyclase (GGDEF)-like protein